jgi:cytochrome c-type biogenesis protein CcmE
MRWYSVILCAGGLLAVSIGLLANWPEVTLVTSLAQLKDVGLQQGFRAWLGVPLRVRGELVEGSLIRRESPCEYAMVLRDASGEQSVQYRDCIVPDSLCDLPAHPVHIVATGAMNADRTQFEASSLWTRGPDRYERSYEAAKEEARHLDRSKSCWRLLRE